LGAAVGGGAELVALQVPGHRDEEASLALVRQYAKQASEGLGEPEDLAVRPLQFAELRLSRLEVQEETGAVQRCRRTVRGATDELD